MALDWTKGSPWNWNLSTKSKKKPLPEGFVELYGKKPAWKDFYLGKGKFSIKYFEYKVILIQWETKLKHYKGPVNITPEDFPEGTGFEKLEVSREIYFEWGMGDLVFYDSTYGIKGRFLNSMLPDYSFSLHHLVEFPQHVVSQYHIEQILRGMDTPSPLHPFVLTTNIRGKKTNEEE